MGKVQRRIARRETAEKRRAKARAAKRETAEGLRENAAKMADMRSAKALRARALADAGEHPRARKHP